MFKISIFIDCYTYSHRKNQGASKMLVAQFERDQHAVAISLRFATRFFTTKLNLEQCPSCKIKLLEFQS